MSGLHADILGTIGNTPVVRINKLAPPGVEIYAKLKERIGTPTIPQVFVGEHHVGGATETFTAYNDGKLQELLKTHGVGFEPKEGLDAYSFMPAWLHPR